MVSDILAEMGGWYVKNNYGVISTTPTAKVLLPGIGITKVKDLYFVYERWSREQGRAPKVKRTSLKSAEKIDKKVLFNDLFEEK